MLLPGHLRSSGFLIGLACTVILLTAWHLEPDHLPLGSRSQLSFPGCAFRDRTGYPCPTCGMITAWSRAARGDLITALRANIAGAVLAVVALFGAFLPLPLLRKMMKKGQGLQGDLFFTGLCPRYFLLPVPFLSHRQSKWLL